MKTLDEVIQAVDYCRFSSDCNPCPYRESKSCAREKMTDALHYLQHYRMLGNDFAEKRQELEDEKARYQEAVRNCEEAELKYRKLAQSLGEVGNAEIPLNPNVVFRPEGVYCGVCGSRLDQDREEE